MKFIVKFLLFSLCIVAAIEAAKLKATGDKKFNNDNPNMAPILSNGKPAEPKPAPAPKPVEPKKVEEEACKGDGYGMFSKTCKDFGYSNWTLTAKCKKRNGTWVSASINLNSYYMINDHNNRFVARSWYNGNLDKYCNQCKVNLKTLYLTCQCNYNSATRTEVRGCLNVWIQNSNGSLTM